MLRHQSKSFRGWRVTDRKALVLVSDNALLSSFRLPAGYDRMMGGSLATRYGKYDGNLGNNVWKWALEMMVDRSQALLVRLGDELGRRVEVGAAPRATAYILAQTNVLQPNSPHQVQKWLNRAEFEVKESHVPSVLIGLGMQQQLSLYTHCLNQGLGSVKQPPEIEAKMRQVQERALKNGVEGTTVAVSSGLCLRCGDSRV